MKLRASDVFRGFELCCLQMERGGLIQGAGEPQDWPTEFRVRDAKIKEVLRGVPREGRGMMAQNPSPELNQAPRRAERAPMRPDKMPCMREDVSLHVYR